MFSGSRCAFTMPARAGRSRNAWASLLWGTLHHSRQSGDTDEAVLVVVDFDVPDVDFFAYAQGAAGGCNAAFAGGAQVVGVDFYAYYAGGFFGFGAEDAGYAADGFGQDDAGASVQQSEGLFGAVIYGHGGTEVVVPEIGEADVELLAHIICRKAIELF